MFTAIQPLLNKAVSWYQYHANSLPSLLTVVLLFSGGAYALASAVVSLGPDVQQLPAHEVIEPVEPLALQPQIDALSKHQFSLLRSDVTRTTDTAESLLKRLGIDDPVALRFLRTDPNVQQTLLGRAGRVLKIELSNRNSLISLTARWSPDDDGSFKRLVITRNENGFSSRLENAALTASLRFASGTIQSSLFAATDDAQVPDAVAIQIAEIFSGDIDFYRELRKGDRFSVVYEMLQGDGEPLRAGRVLNAEFVNVGKPFQAMWFQESAANATLQLDEVPTTHSLTRGGYYTLEGQSLKRAYLASPLAFSRITSGFKMRMHPILQQWRAHLGVDFGAPTGTPVRSVGDGVVEFAGAQGGYGNAVFIRHRNNHVTVYAHLSRISVQRGQRVIQGQNIGATGATGWATGPHLHYEFRVNGVHQNPLAIARRSESIPVPSASKPRFLRLAAEARQHLAAASMLQSVSSQ